MNETESTSRAEPAGRDEPGEPRITVRMTVNRKAIERQTSPRLLLSDFLRHELGLHGTHVGCEHGVCGCCTVLLDGSSARSCLLLAAQCEGAAITTIEGLSPDGGGLSPVQRALHEEHAMQCGFCTPGFVATVTELLAEGRGPDELSDRELREALAGNLCRCTGYQNIVKAVRRGAELLREEED